MPTVTFNGGPVLSHIEVVSIYLNIDINGVPTGDWGSLKVEDTALPLASELDLFLDDILRSEYMDPLAEYSVGRGRRLGPSHFLTARNQAGHAFDIPTFGPPNLVGTYPTPNTIQEALHGNTMHIVPFLTATIRAGTLPPPRPNLCYFVFLPPGVLAGQNVGGLHASFPLPGFSEVYYAVIVHPQSDQPLNPRTTPEDFQKLTRFTSHELAEAVTDPQVEIIEAADGFQSVRGTGWRTDEPPPPGIIFPPDCNREIADLCQSRGPIFHGYQVSDFWSEQRQQGVLCPIQIRLNNGVCFAGGGIDAGGAIEGQTAHFSVNVPCILPGVGLAYRWAVSGASTPMETHQPDFIVTMPPAPSTVTISVTVSTNGFNPNPGCGLQPPDGDVSAEATYRSITLQEAEHLTFLCEFYSRIIKYAYVNIFVNPLWDPLRDFSLTPLLWHEVREMHQIALQLSRLTGRLLHLSEVGLEQGTEVEHPRAEP